MSILPSQHIRRLCTEGWMRPVTWTEEYIDRTGRERITHAEYARTMMIEPFAERTEFNGKTFGLGPATYDCRCRQHLIIHPQSPLLLSEDIKENEQFILELQDPIGPRRLGFSLASTIEKVYMPHNVRATVCDKSSWARRGLAVQNTKIDPGFIGHITLELSNHGHEVIEILEGEAIMQLEFAYLTEDTDIPYRGKYQNAPDRATPALEGKGQWSVAQATQG